MGDIYCPRCGEPWDADELHELVAMGYQPSFSAALGTFRRAGCSVFDVPEYGSSACSTQPASDRAQLSGMLMDLLGDDVDGLIAEMEDAEYMFR